MIIWDAPDRHSRHCLGGPVRGRYFRIGKLGVRMYRMLHSVYNNYIHTSCVCVCVCNDGVTHTSTPARRYLTRRGPCPHGSGMTIDIIIYWSYCDSCATCNIRPERRNRHRFPRVLLVMCDCIVSRAMTLRQRCARLFGRQNTIAIYLGLVCSNFDGFAIVLVFFFFSLQRF